MRFFRRKTHATPGPFPAEETANDTRILVISNCQVQPLQHGLANVCRNVQVDAVPVHVISPNDRGTTFSRYVARKEEYACVLSIPLSDEYGPFASSVIREAFAPTPVISIANIYFDGTLPDICYIGGLNARMPGPISDYHSRIALLGYLMELPVETTVKMYGDAVYSRLGYYHTFQQSLDEMARRDAEVDIPLGELLENKVREGNCFLSQNHPTSLLTSAYVNRIGAELAKRELVQPSGLLLSPETCVNFLAFSVIFPVYPEIAAHHGLAYETSYIFRTATIGDEPSKPISLQDFVCAEYSAFKSGDQTVLRSTWPGCALMQLHGDDPAFQKLVTLL